MSCLLSHDLSSLGFSDLAEVRAIFPRCEIDPIIQYVVLGLGVKVINLNISHESSRNELKYSLKIAFMSLSIILKFQVPDINILLGIRKKATVFDRPWSANLVLGPRLR